MKCLRMGISTCPNDTFIYEALATGAYHCGLDLEFEYHDVQTLNEMVRLGELDAAKVSCGVLPELLESYGLLLSGGAMGFGCGPLLLSTLSRDFSQNNETCLPGRDTTASLLFRFWCEQKGVQAPVVRYALFDELYRLLRQGDVAQGVVIHEHRFTWERDGLHLVADLGEFWEQVLGVPIPLGCAVVRRDLGPQVAKILDEGIQKSLSMAWSRRDPITPYVRRLAQIDDDGVILAHIRTFVTQYSKNLGSDGDFALQTLLSLWERMEAKSLPEGSLFAY